MNGITHTKEKKPQFDLDVILGPIGGFGKFQMVNLLYISVIIALAAISETAYVFTAGGLDSRCLIPECEYENSSYVPPWLSEAIPEEADGDLKMCRRFTARPTITNGTCDNSSFTESVFECDSLKYETDEWTIARENWGLDCDSIPFMLSLIGSFNNAGEVIGSLFVGFLSDRYGRKSVIVSVSAIVAIIGTIKSFSVGYIMFAILEFIEAMMTGGLFTLPFVLALEIVDPSKRVLASIIVSCFYPIGEISVVAVQWLTFDWRATLMIVRAPFLLVVLYFWTMPESVRWLMAKGRKADAIEVLRRIARTNSTVLSEDAVTSIMKEDSSEEACNVDEKAEFAALWHSKKLRLRFGVILFIWIANTFIFYGLNLNSTNIDDNKFLNYIFVCLVEIPSYLTVYALLDTVGRRVTQSSSLFVCALSCLIYAFVGEDVDWAQTLLFLIGKSGIAISFITIAIYTSELIPTHIRGSAICIGNMAGRIAAILAPQTPLLADIYEPAPLLMFSLLSAVGAFLALTLPETCNTKLPDSVAEAEKLGSRTRRSSSMGAPSSEVAPKRHESFTQLQWQ